MFLGLLIGLAVVISIIAVVRLDWTGSSGSGLSSEFTYDVNELAAVEPNLILYEEPVKPIPTGLNVSKIRWFGSHPSYRYRRKKTSSMAPQPPDSGSPDGCCHQSPFDNPGPLEIPNKINSVQGVASDALQLEEPVAPQLGRHAKIVNGAGYEPYLPAVDNERFLVPRKGRHRYSPAGCQGARPSAAGRQAPPIMQESCSGVKQLFGLGARVPFMARSGVAPARADETSPPWPSHAPPGGEETIADTITVLRRRLLFPLIRESVVRERPAWRRQAGRWTPYVQPCS